jgi:hypothetical protein
MNTTRIGGKNFDVLLHRFPMQRGLLFGTLIVAALLAFEIFNYSTTDYALADLLGDLRFAGVRWATILALAFCGIDFAGIARLFTPEEGGDEPREIWYLFGAWMLAATMNAMLTWWGVSLAIMNHETLGNAIVERQTLLRVVPIFVAIMVWLIRVLIIGTFSVAGERLFTQTDSRPMLMRSDYRPANGRSAVRSLGSHRPLSEAQTRASIPASTSFRPSTGRASYRQQQLQQQIEEPEISGYTRPEPTYHPATMSGRNESGASNVRR